MIARQLQRRCACGGTPGPDGECAACQAKRLQRSALGAGPAVAPPLVQDVVRSSGRPLDEGVRGEMEARFGHDFSRVRVHTDARAAESARAVDARAYAVGTSVVFGNGRYAPATAEGRELLAHELGHVVQQRGATPVPARLPVAHPDSPLERDVQRPSARTTPQVQRQTDEDAERRKAVEEAEALVATMGLDEEEEAEEAALLKIAERATDPRFTPGGFTDDDIYGEYEAATKAIDEELAPPKDPRPFKKRFKQAQKEALDRPILSHDEGGSHESIWRYGLNKGLFAERERTLVADTLLAPYAAKAERSRRQWEIKKYNAQINRFRNFRAQLQYGFIQGALLGRPGVPPIIRGGYFSYGVAHTSVEAYRGYQAGDPSRVVGAVLPLAAGYGFHRIAGMGEPPIPLPRGLPPLGRVLNPQRGKPVEVYVEDVLAVYAKDPAFVKKLGSDPWAQAMWEIQGGEGVHPMAWRHPNGRVVYVNEARWTGKLSEINQPHELVPVPTAPVAGAQAAVAPPATVPMRPGTITVETSIRQGLVNPDGRLAPVLRAIQDEYAKGAPTDKNQGLDLVTRAAASVGLHRGSRSQPSPSEYLLENVKGVYTRILDTGEIIVTNKAGQVVLHLIP